MPRVNSTQPVAVQRAGSRPLETSIDASAFQFDDSEARAIGQVGSIMTELGKREIAARDSLAISQTAKMRQQAMLEMDQFKVDNPDSSTWKQGQLDINNKYRQEVNKLKMTDRARNQVNQESDSFAEMSAMTTQIQATSTAIDQDIATTGASAIQAITTGGDDPGSEMAMTTALAQHEQALLRKYPPEVAAAHMLVTTQKGEEGHEQFLVDGLRNEAVVNPLLTIERIDAEIKARKSGEQTDFIGIESTDLNAAKSLAKSTIVEAKNQSQAQYDLAVGEASVVISEGLLPGSTMTGNDVRNMKIDVPKDKQEDLLIFKDKWAGVFDANAERTRKMQEGVDKKKREDAYNPGVVAELKNAAKKATTPTQVDEIKLRAAQALTDNVINDEDLEQINTSADGVFTTAVDKEVDEQDNRLRPIMLRGTSTESFTPWLTAQIRAQTMSGITPTADTIAELSKTFEDVARAKTWAAGEVKSQVEAEIRAAKESESPMSVKDVRLAYLQQQKIWLSKTDIELTEEYNAWLKSKP